MVFSSLSLAKVSRVTSIIKRFLRPGRHDLIFAAFLGIVMVCALLAVFSGYLFYTTVTRELMPHTSVTKKYTPVSARDIDEIIHLLDERDKKFNEILNKK